MMAANVSRQSDLKNDIRVALTKTGLSRIEKDILGKCEQIGITSFVLKNFIHCVDLCRCFFC
jgi:hypothetical protein